MGGPKVKVMEEEPTRKPQARTLFSKPMREAVSMGNNTT